MSELGPKKSPLETSEVEHIGVYTVWVLGEAEHDGLEMARFDLSQEFEGPSIAVWSTLLEGIPVATKINE